MPLSMAPAESQKAIKEFGRPDTTKLIADNPLELPLDPEKLVVAFRRWDEQVGGAKSEVSGGTVTAVRHAIARRSFRELRLDRPRPRLRRRSTRAARRRPDDPRGRVHRPARPLGLRQVDRAELHRRAAAADRRRHLAGRQRIDPLRPEERGFGMVFQNYALFPHMTVRSNVGFGLVMRGVPQGRDRARGSTRRSRWCGSRRRRDKLPGQLSGGQQQRVAIARAIVVEPPLVLMDEPLSNLDAKLRLEMRAEIRRIHHMLGSTTIYVTHDQEEALSLADRIVVLRDGQVRQVGTPEDLLRAARHLGRRRVHGLPQPAAVAWCRSTASRHASSVAGGAQLTGTRARAVRAGRRAVVASGPTTCVPTRPTAPDSLRTVEVGRVPRPRVLSASATRPTASELHLPRAIEPLAP